MASSLGQIVINLAFLVGAIAYLFNQDWFACNNFDGRLVDTGKWWLLGDNYEAQVIALVVLFQFVNSAMVCTQYPFHYSSLYPLADLQLWSEFQRELVA